MNTLLVKNEEDVYLIVETRRGNYVRTIREPGLHVIPPWQKVAHRTTKHMVNGMDAMNLRSREQTPVTLSFAFDYLITDPGKYHCAAKEPHKALSNELKDAFRAAGSPVGLADLWEQRDYITTQALHAVRQPVEEKFGIALSDMRVQQISVDSKCMSAPCDTLKQIMKDAAAAPDKVADAMGEGLEKGMKISKPLQLRRP